MGTLTNVCVCLILLLCGIDANQMTCSFLPNEENFSCRKDPNGTVVFEITITVENQTGDIGLENTLDKHLIENGRLCFTYESLRNSTKKSLVEISEAKQGTQKKLPFGEWFLVHWLYAFYIILIAMSLPAIFLLFGLFHSKIWNCKSSKVYRHPKSTIPAPVDLAASRPPHPSPPEDRHRWVNGRDNVGINKYTNPNLLDKQDTYDQMPQNCESEELYSQLPENGEEYSTLPYDGIHNSKGNSMDYATPKNDRKQNNKYANPVGSTENTLKFSFSEEKNPYESPRDGRKRVNPSQQSDAEQFVRPRKPPQHMSQQSSQQLSHMQMMADMHNRIGIKKKDHDLNQNPNSSEMRHHFQPNDPIRHGFSKPNKNTISNTHVSGESNPQFNIIGRLPDSDMTRDSYVDRFSSDEEGQGIYQNQELYQNY